MTRLSSVLLAGACFLVGSVHLPAAEEVSEQTIAQALASFDSHLRHETWKKLNPENSAHYKILVQILKTRPWYDRQGAAIALSKAATEDTVKKMVKALKDDKDVAMRQGMADALARMNDEKFYPHLYEALKDKDPTMRRMVAWNLRVHKKKEAVEALVMQLQEEKDPVVKSFILDSLNDLTKAFQGTSPLAWMTWWLHAKADKDYELGKTDEEAERKAEELGNKLKSRTTVSVAGGVELESEERGGTEIGGGVPILVLPEYGRSKEIMKPFLSELERTNKIFYIDLPHVSKFKDVKVISDARIPFYPIDQLVEAFEDLRKATGQERFALMACGMNGWIAMRYATKYPKSVSHLVLIGPMSSNKVFSDSLDRLERDGKAKNDVELWHYAMAHSFNTKTGENNHDLFHKDKKIPVPDGEDGSLDRRGWSLYFKDERDSLIATLYGKKDRDLGRVAIPDFRCFVEAKGNIPTIVINGKANPFANSEDCKQIAKHFGGPNGQFYEYPASSRMPFAEESTVFNKHMASLLREKGGKAKAKGKSKGKSKEAEPEKAPDKSAEKANGKGEDK